MQIKTFKIALLALSAVAGLLLGESVKAAWEDVAANDRVLLASVEQTDEMVQQIQQKVNELTVQIKEGQDGQLIVEIKPVLSQEKLDYVQSEINRISSEVARIKAEVQILVQINEVKAKIANLQQQLALKTSSEDGQDPVIVVGPGSENAQAPSMTPVVEAEPVGREAIEAKVVSIKQQISELTKQLEIEKAKEQGSEVAQVQSAEQENQQPTEQISQPAEEESDYDKKPADTTSEEEVKESEKKSFWQSIGDFFRKLFSF